MNVVEVLEELNDLGETHTAQISQTHPKCVSIVIGHHNQCEEGQCWEDGSVGANAVRFEQVHAQTKPRVGFNLLVALAPRSREVNGVVD